MALLRRAWFQIHWFIGITAGSLLLVIGLSGALLSFRAEITDLIDPALRRLPHAADARPLAPAELLERLQAAQPGRR
ncbi:MAG TPA: PepSY domain-containing protein, partial [Variovorax sp.]|nr:PepSY domain-containing protein [Variovorax sp.]